MIEDKGVCPHCGRELHRKPYTMAVNPDAPGIWGLLHGEGEPFMQFLAWTAVLLVAIGVVTALFSVAGIH